MSAYEHSLTGAKRLQASVGTMSKRQLEPKDCCTTEEGEPNTDAQPGRDVVQLAARAALELDTQLEALHAAVALRIAEFDGMGVRRSRPPAEPLDEPTAEFVRAMREKLRSVAAKLRRAHGVLDELFHGEDRARARVCTRCRAKSQHAFGGPDVGA